MGLRAKGEKCDAIDGILEEADGILEDFGGTLAGDAAIIFSARAVEHYEICRYSAMVGFADALGLDTVHETLNKVLSEEQNSDDKLTALAEGSINEAASEYDEEELAADPK
jgi:ferritin-like metal-binding protein YciE